MFNKKKLVEVIQDYMKDFENGWWDDEEFKWKAIKSFRQNWNIEADNMSEMLKVAFKDTQNLLCSAQFFPVRMIEKFAENYPEKVRNMFIDLYDETKKVTDRIKTFKDESEELLLTMPESKSHFQTENSISTYLWLRYPEKYYIYKFSEVKSVATTLETDVTFKSGDYENNIINFLNLYDEISATIKENDNLCHMLDTKLKEIGCTDPNYHTLALDIGFYISRVFAKKQESQTKKYWLYAPGPNAEKWNECKAKGIMLLGWGELGNLQEYKSQDDMKVQMQSIYQKSGSCKNDALATWDFLENINVGDVVFAKNGISEIVGRGIVTSEYLFDENRDDSYNNVRSVKWDEQENYKVEKVLPQKTLTDITKDSKLINELEKVFIDSKGEDDSNPDSSTRHYWFLNAKPSIWSFSDIKTGEQVAYDLYNANGNKRRIFQNFLDARQGDLVIGYESTPIKQIVALGTISKENDGEKLYFEKTEDLIVPIDYDEFKTCPELQNMEYLVSPQGSLFKLTEDEYEILMDIVRELNPISKKNQYVDSYSKEDFLSEVFMDSDKYDRLVSVLKRKKNIVLQGAPGVGKTYAAKRLAYSMMEKKDESRIEFVQFHQNYSYEDFMMGYKPDGSDFKLKTGVFYNFCKKASNDPGNDYFFIIDEINRGNMSKIFGELLMAIEADYRDTLITLAYDNKSFTVPKNLYIIGMMNTADRSLAMIDYALRRRFSFINMEPGFETEGFLAYQKELDYELFDKLIENIKELNKEIIKDNSLGKGFCIGHSYFCKLTKETCNTEVLRNIVDFDIIPMLEEYWFDEESNVEKWTDILDGVFR